MTMEIQQSRTIRDSAAALMNSREFDIYSADGAAVVAVRRTVFASAPAVLVAIATACWININKFINHY